ncbi:MAG TPA: type II toxin-antitoxin system HipA family toxin, partial [Nannocystaceae bacterium]|nr:type II toxin-antitoxin system HipA family toxin [Nannocystaceae bacterium]
MSELFVVADGERIGTLRERSDTRFEFEYDASWLASPRRFAISRSLPLRRDAFETEAERFFGNLLPEGGVRLAVCRRLGLSDENDFALLRAIGRECAGALSIVEDVGAARQSSYRPIDDDELERWASLGAYASAVGGDLRLSLAGAQDKLGVRVDGDTLSLPESGAPSTHLLKLPNRDFAALPQNEALVLELARRLDLGVVESRLWMRTSTPLLLVTRFDRIDGTPIRRLHQEDFCQALAVDRRRKYEVEGGPSFARCLELVRDTSDALSHSRRLLRWLVFCAVVGNRDNHAKNISFVRDDLGRWRLAPFYDLVCTTAYDRLSRRLAMSIGTRDHADNLPASAWRDEAAALGIKPKYLLAL